MNRLRIESRAPTRIDLAGGTLDIWPLYLFHPGALTVNCAITRYASCVIETNSTRGGEIHLVSRDTKRQESFASIEALERARRYRLPLLAHLVRFFRPRTGLTLTTDSQAPAGAGIGGSSAMAVAICAALDRLTGAALRLEDWIHISRDAEAIVIRVPTGTQDHYPPAFGGASAIHLEPGGERREEVGCDLDELERRLVLCYTGKPKKHGINNWEVFQKHIRGRPAHLAESGAHRGRGTASVCGAEPKQVGRDGAADSRGVGVSAAQFAHDFDAGDRPGDRRGTAARGAGGQSVRRGWRRVCGFADRSGGASEGGGGGDGGWGRAFAARNRSGGRADPGGVGRAVGGLGPKTGLGRGHSGRLHWHPIGGRIARLSGEERWFVLAGLRLRARFS